MQNKVKKGRGLRSCLGDRIIPCHKAKMLYLSNLEKKSFRIAGALKLHFSGFSVLTIYLEYRILRKMPTTFFRNVLSLLDKKRSHFTTGLEFIHRHQCNILVTHPDFTLKDDPSDVKLAMVFSCCQLPLSYIKTVNNKVLK